MGFIRLTGPNRNLSLRRRAEAGTKAETMEKSRGFLAVFLMQLGIACPVGSASPVSWTLLHQSLTLAPGPS